MVETKQSVNQDFINCYSWIIRINHTIQVTHIRKGFKKKRHNQFYTGSPHRAMTSLLCTTYRESFTNSINCSHTINQQISTPRRNQNPAKLIQCSLQPLINFSRKPQANSYSPDQSISTPRKNQNPANWSTAPHNFQSISAENTGLLLKPKPVQTFNELHKITIKTPQILIQTGSRRV